MNLVEFIIEESQRLHGPNNTQQLNLCKHVEQPYAVLHGLIIFFCALDNMATQHALTCLLQGGSG